MLFQSEKARSIRPGYAVFEIIAEFSVEAARSDGCRNLHALCPQKVFIRLQRLNNLSSHSLPHTFRQYKDGKEAALVLFSPIWADCAAACNDISIKEHIKMRPRGALDNILRSHFGYDFLYLFLGIIAYIHFPERADDHARHFARILRPKPSYRQGHTTPSRFLIQHYTCLCPRCKVPPQDM